MKKSATKDGVQEICVDSWQEFFAASAELFSAPAFVYRGQANYDWPLKTTLDRLQELNPKRKNLCSKDPDPVVFGEHREWFDRPPLTEDQHLTAFKTAIRGRRGANAPKLSDDEYWALGQHHGLATPFLDWTRAPFAALFFAFEEENCQLASGKWGTPKFRGVYMLTSTITDDPDGLRVLSTATESNYRIISQAGLLIRIPRQQDVETYVRGRFTGQTHEPTFTKIRIPNEDRTPCLVALNKMNINRMTLFPDIDGAARYVNSIWQPGHEDLIAFIKDD